MEKTDRLDARDVETNLCIMLLMLQSANRETQDSLKIFQDRGDVHGFFPPEGEQQAHQAAFDRTPNLSGYEGMFPMVKDSLGNALRIIRPIVILDEGHRAVAELAFRTLYGFNPCFVLELTATPQDVQPRGGKNPREARYANLLVEVTGRELDREGMIKMPLNLDPRQGSDWRGTLYASELNSEEREVAVYLDGEKALIWWHRNVARTQYGLQGWRKAKIYPDFIFAVERDGAAKRITILETKGDQLDNLDTAYKREALSFLSGHFRWDNTKPVGELELVKDQGEIVQGTLILMSEWRSKLPAYLQ